MKIKYDSHQKVNSFKHGKLQAEISYFDPSSCKRLTQRYNYVPFVAKLKEYLA